MSPPSWCHDRTARQWTWGIPKKRTSPASPSAIRLGRGALVVVAGPSASGKSSWASEWFLDSQVVSSDRLRAVVGNHEHDLQASAHAFELLDAIVERRMTRGLVTVVDTLGMDRDRHERWLAMAHNAGRSAHLVRFETDAGDVSSEEQGARGCSTSQGVEAPS